MPETRCRVICNEPRCTKRVGRLLWANTLQLDWDKRCVKQIELQLVAIREIHHKPKPSRAIPSSSKLSRHDNDCSGCSSAIAGLVENSFGGPANAQEAAPVAMQSLSLYIGWLVRSPRRIPRSNTELSSTLVIGLPGRPLSPWPPRKPVDTEGINRCVFEWGTHSSGESGPRRFSDRSGVGSRSEDAKDVVAELAGELRPLAPMSTSDTSEDWRWWREGEAWCKPTWFGYSQTTWQFCWWSGGKWPGWAVYCGPRYAACAGVCCTGDGCWIAGSLAWHDCVDGCSGKALGWRRWTFRAPVEVESTAFSTERLSACLEAPFAPAPFALTGPPRTAACPETFSPAARNRFGGARAGFCFETAARRGVAFPAIFRSDASLGPAWAALPQLDSQASWRVCHTEWLDRLERHLNFLSQPARGHSNGVAPVCSRKWAFKLYFLEKPFVQPGYVHICIPRARPSARGGRSAAAPFAFASAMTDVLHEWAGEDGFTDGERWARSAVQRVGFKGKGKATGGTTVNFWRIPMADGQLYSFDRYLTVVIRVDVLEMKLYPYHTLAK